MDIRPLVGKQAQAVALRDAHILAYEGAVRSSKTICCLLSFLEFIRFGPPGNLLMAGRTERTLRRNCLDVLVDMLGPERCRIVSGSGEAWILGRRVYLVGGDNERSQEKLRGLSLVGALLDEASTMPQSFVAMLMTRMSQAGSKVWISTNPEGPQHWLKTGYLDKARLHLDRDSNITTWPCETCDQLHCDDQCDGDGRLDLYRFSFQLADNPTLRPEYKRNLAASLTGLHYRRWILGDWCIAEGAIYEAWDPQVHVVDELPTISRVLGVGIDHGTVNPTHAVTLALTADGRLAVTREWRYDSRAAGKQLTNAEYAARLRVWLDSDPPHPKWIVVDPAAQGLKLDLQRAGLRGLQDADNAVVDGIREVASLLATRRLIVHRSCTGLISEIPGYCWDDKAAEKGEDRPVKVADHGLDATRYVIKTLHPVWRKAVPLTPWSPAT